MNSLEILKNYSGTFDLKILNFTPQVGTQRPFLIKIILKLPRENLHISKDEPQKVPGPDPKARPPSDIPKWVGRYPYLNCIDCANCETFLDIHKMATYLCHSTGEFIIHPGSREICETFTPMIKEEEEEE